MSALEKHADPVPLRDNVIDFAEARRRKMAAAQPPAPVAPPAKDAAPHIGRRVKFGAALIAICMLAMFLTPRIGVM